MRDTGVVKDGTPGCCSCTCQSCCVRLRGQPATKRTDISGQGQEERNRAAWEGRGMGTTSELSLFCTEDSLCDCVCVGGGLKSGTVHIRLLTWGLGDTVELLQCCRQADDPS